MHYTQQGDQGRGKRRPGNVCIYVHRLVSFLAVVEVNIRKVKTDAIALKQSWVRDGLKIADEITV